MKVNKSLLFVVAALLVVLSACTNNSTPNPPTPAVTQSVSIPWIAMKNTTRINSSDPIIASTLVSQTIWPATGEGNRPGGIILVDAEDWRAGLVGANLIHFPINGPVLFTVNGEIPQATIDEVQRLKPTGFNAGGTKHAVIVGASTERIQEQLTELKIAYDQIAAESPAALAAAVDNYYSGLQNNEVPLSVVVGSLDAPEYSLPAVNWISHMSEPLLFVTKDKIPAETVEALNKRNGSANIYLLGPDSIVSTQVEEQLREYGKVTRIAGKDPIENAMAFARFYDVNTQFGWGINSPGHNFSFVPINSTSLAVAAAPFSHLGKHAPLLWMEAKRVPKSVMDYLDSVQPRFEHAPSDGPFNHAWITGDLDAIAHSVHGDIDEMLEIISTNAESGGGHAGH